MVLSVNDDKNEDERPFPLDDRDSDNEAIILQMFKEYSESDTPYISRNYISTTLGISLNKVTTTLNNLVNQKKIEYDVETNKYRLIIID